MAKFKQGDKVRLKKDYYKHDWFKAWDRENRKRISLGANKVARVTLEDMFVVCPTYPLKNVAEIRFNDRTYLQVHEDMLEYAVANKPTYKHSYTAEQIAEAQRIIGELVADSNNGKGCRMISDTKKKKCFAIVGCNTYTAHCSDGDEYNRYIGIMIALCRANGRKVPDWVYGNE